MRGIEFPDFRKESDQKEVMEIIYKALTDINNAIKQIDVEPTYTNEVRLFVADKTRLLPAGFAECNGKNGTYEITDIAKTTITQKIK